MTTREHVAYTLAIADACHRYGIRWTDRSDGGGEGIHGFKPIADTTFPDGRWLPVGAVSRLDDDDEMLWYGPLVSARVKQDNRL